MTVFVDTGVDKNNDGADDAYVIYSSEMNAKLYVSLLNKDYTGLAAEADQAGCYRVRRPHRQRRQP